MRSPALMVKRDTGIDIYDPSLKLYLPLHDHTTGVSPFISKDLYHYTATVTGAIWGKYGRTFDGDDNIATTAAATLVGATALTLEAWVKWAASPQTSQAVFESTSANCWGLGGGWTANKWAFWIHATTWQSSGNSTSNIDTAWHHMVGTYNGAALVVIIDTVVQASGAVTGNATRDGNIKLGETAAGAGDFKGIIGEARVYNRVLTAPEIMRNYQNTKRRYI